jgi:hypothetical protein
LSFSHSCDLTRLPAGFVFRDEVTACYSEWLAFHKDISFSGGILECLSGKRRQVWIGRVLHRLQDGSPSCAVLLATFGWPLSKKDISGLGRSVYGARHADAEHERNWLIETLIHHVCSE